MTPNSYSLCARQRAKHFICVTFFKYPPKPYIGGIIIIIIPILMMQKLRLGEAEGLVQGHIETEAT